MSKILIFHRDGILLKVRNIHLSTLWFIHLHKVWFKLLRMRMIFSYNFLGSSANMGPMVLWTTVITHVCIFGFRRFTLILEVWDLMSEVRVFLGSVSSLRWALALLTLTRWLLVTPTTPILVFRAFVCAIICFRHNSRTSRSSLDDFSSTADSAFLQEVKQRINPKT